MGGTGHSVAGEEVAFPGRTLYDNERVSDVLFLSPHIILGSEMNGQTGDCTWDSGVLLVIVRTAVGNAPEPQFPLRIHYAFTIPAAQSAPDAIRTSTQREALKVSLLGCWYTRKSKREDRRKRTERSPS